MKMTIRSSRWIPASLALVPFTAMWLGGCGSGKKVDYSTEVKPILNKHCISCHGGVKQSGGFSVLFREEALGVTKSGKPAIVPGDASASEFIRRLHTKDPKERMPLKAAPLSKDEIDILTRWVEQGAEWGEHWAYVSPKPPAAGATIDQFINDKLDDENLDPAPQADPQTLLRRLSLDITGIPPSEARTAAFSKSFSEETYAKMVDSLLASPQFGEKWASMWLDLARYADTKGYEKDSRRDFWRYRDWVIQAFNKDMPFNEFTVDQLAGDLLPNPTQEQYIATAFHRNTMNNDEGGTQDEEFRTAAIIDRVNTTMEVWQGTTIACVQCHAHPYDPFHFEDYYKLMAFLNNTRDEDTPGEYPRLRFYDSLQRTEVDAVSKWVAQYGNASQVKDTEDFLRALEPKVHAHDADQFINGELADTKYISIRNGGSCRMKNVPLNEATTLLLRYWSGGGRLEIRSDSLKGPVVANIELPKGNSVLPVALKPLAGRHDLFFIFRNPAIDPMHSVAGVEWMAFRHDLPGKGQPGYKEMETKFMQLVNAYPDGLPIMVENTPELFRPTYVFERGNWLVHGPQVQPATPGSLNPFPEGAPRNRLGLAQWITDPKNPLTSRVMVNRLWEQLFGIGLVETLEDFGTQGFAPSHPELLDYLAYQFVHKHKWSVKSMLREIVLSSAYRRDSKSSPELQEKDPANRLLARGPRFRLSAEQVRDQALAVSGLLNLTMSGPAVMPLQPEGVWMTVYSGDSWKTSENGNQHRRGVYTFLRRTSPYPSAITFDGSSREVCLQRRIRTNTPLQALTTLNDPVFLEAARTLAERMGKDGGSDAKACIKRGYQLAMNKDITDAKTAVLEKLYRQALEQYQKDPAAADSLNMRQFPEKEKAHLAALTIVANALLNLDEFLTKS
ncbi:DUF1553 domain-containing protein [Chitinophaga caseinilytica]|uniref:DUF1553 domain-containing protein n=1 Tax=Chitinophaga caseinilytica TaxID=2267521 RepID=A0ABZ2Z8G9_9BACT